jgi:indolepyruvate ferredoxin oxidoreductase alpha subunit
LLTGVTGAVFNRDDSVLIIMNNGYASATGQQDIPSGRSERGGRGAGLDIEAALRSLGVAWIRRVRSYGVRQVLTLLAEALGTKQKGLKVIIADGECQLARQRRIGGWQARRLANGQRAKKTRFRVDPEVCTGDHACIRLSGCPSLTIAPSPDPLRSDPVAQVTDACVGCGLCGEIAHAARLCPSFAQVDIIHNPNAWDRLRARVSRLLIGLCAGTRRPPGVPAAPLAAE